MTDQLDPALSYADPLIIIPHQLHSYSHPLFLYSTITTLFMFSPHKPTMCNYPTLCHHQPQEEPFTLVFSEGEEPPYISV